MVISMKNIMKLELKKICSKKDVMLMFGIIILIPLFMAVCIVNEVAGISFGGAVSVDGFGLLIWSFLKYLFVLYLVPIYVCCSFLGKEVETRSINIMLSNQKRSTILAAKAIVYIAVLTLFFALFQGASVLTFQLLLNGTEYGAAMEASVMETVFAYLFQWLELMFVLFLAMVLCSIIKGNAALLLGMIIVILQRVLVNFDGIKKFVPYYISDYSSYVLIPGEQLAGSNVMSTMVYAVILVVLALGAMRIWRNRDF